MRLWKLTPRHDSLWWCEEGRDPWHPHYDRAFGFLVRAPDEEAARWLAHQGAGEENGALEGVSPWLDDGYSRCEEVRADGAEEILLVNFRHGR